jgi:hypothetical protein
MELGCDLILFWEPLTSMTPVATITIAMSKISPVAILETTHVAIVLICSSA